MASVDPERKEKTTRDKLAIAVAKEILAGRGGPNGGVWVSLKHIPDNLLAYHQEWYESGLGFHAFDPRKFLPDLRYNGIEVVPVAHFWCVGITIDEDCRTTILGLYALSLENICDCLEAVALSALERTESRGSHYRSDCPAQEAQLYTTNIHRKCNCFETYRTEGEGYHE